MSTYELDLFINDIDNYIKDIKNAVSNGENSYLYVTTLYHGLRFIISQLNQYKKYVPNKRIDLALEKLYNLQTITEINLDERDLF